MRAQVELLKLELDRVRVERDRLRDTLEIVRATSRGVLRWAEVRKDKRVRETFKFLRDLAAEELDGLEPPADLCTHREGDGVCAACSNGVER